MKKYLSIFMLIICSSWLKAQVEVDKKIEFSGTGQDAKIEGIQEVINDNDAANKKYVDDAVSPLQNAITNLQNSGACNLGDVGPGGGKVFYCGAPLKLESRTADQGNYTWGCTGANISGTSTAFLSGLSNTSFITAGCASPSIAAKICADLVSGGKDDWYLPSKDESTILYSNRIIIGGFTNGDYWSSSQADSDNTWRTDFANGNQVAVSKGSTITVRCIRSF